MSGDVKCSSTASIRHSSRKIPTVPKNLIELNRQQHIAMICNNTKQSQRKVFSVFLLKLLILLACSSVVTQAATIEKYKKFNLTESLSAPTNNHNHTTKFPTHRYSSHDNITILHEIRENETEKPLVLNTHEVLPLKPVKKKPYTLLDKDIIAEYEKQRPLKKYELSPVIFDFNLGDLEDLEHESSIKKGDLSAEEEKHLIHNADSSIKETSEESSEDAGLRYSEHLLEDDVSVQVDMTQDSGTVDGSTPTTKTTTTTIAMVPQLQENVSEFPVLVTVSPHIFKVPKSKNSKKGRELMKKDEAHKGAFSSALNLNSVSRYFGVEGALDADDDNATSSSLHATANLFQIMTNLYDHFYWQASDIQRVVSTACGLEMQAYLTGLHGNYEWAQRAYDSSGRYRGQLLYGNDKWLGQKQFCNELNRQLRPDERKHFQFEFSMALIAMRLWLPEKLDIQLQLGECLPTTCSAHDVQEILSLDPHAHMVAALALAPSTGNSSNSTVFRVHGVRKVPGTFSYWGEVKFHLFLSFMFTLILVVLAASWYQSRLDELQLSTPIPAISAQVDAATGASGKPFELYQMKTLNENNNIVEIDGGVLSEINGNSNGNGVTDNDTNSHDNTECVTDKSQQTPDYKLDSQYTGGADSTLEAKKQLGLPERILLCFAFQSNTNTILNIDSNKESQTSCVHGLRVISLLWTIMVHTYLQMFAIAENRYKRVIVERSVWYQIVGNATFSVDTFFFISGFLVTLLYLKQAVGKCTDDKPQFWRRGFIDTSIMWLYRYIRLTPAYLFVIFFNDFSLRETFDNSVFQSNVQANTCGQYWWRNILYINNFYPLSEICMIWSWYMANDMQFYIMATCLLIISTRYFKTAVLIAFAFLLSSWGVSGVVSLHYHYTHKVAFPFESFDFLYDKPWQRVGPYIMGMITGYIIYKVKTPPKISSRTNYILWASSLGLLALIIFGVWYGELSEVNTAFYVGVGHTAFGLGLVWIVLSCCWGFSPTINRILSYRCLWPLSRLTYCTYLIHPILMLIISFRMSGTVHLNNAFILTVFLGNAVISFAVAFFISVLLEAPIIRLLKIGFRK